jgi:hypothetical protein
MTIPDLTVRRLASCGGSARHCEEAPRGESAHRAPGARSVHVRAAGPDRLRQREDAGRAAARTHRERPGYLETFKPDDFAGAEDRRIVLPWTEGTWMTGAEYLIQFALPNFYFHLTTAYSILRHNGVEIGKLDYIGGIPLKNP